MRLRLIALLPLFLLAACVDTTGIAKSSTRPPHPKSTINGIVTVVEYADLQCPACRAANELIVKPLLEQRGNVIRYEFHHFPLVSIHRNALMAAQASECAADQGKFWDFVDTAYENQDKLSPDAVTTWAEELNLDMDLFERCLKSGIKKEIALAEYDEGRALGVQGTPTFFINGEKVETDLNGMMQTIDEKAKGMGQRL